ncbi:MULTISPECIES: pyridoxamine 5'-phosphate oxidase family protein [unclassified Rathayibacter]|uniref:pyridoxamine 5'-phosphate oxidase family protein n=1 Tax=unclassified Rathayibacter TaxID=2609250 RepID=UPI000CE7E2B7|nr:MULTISPECIES: pyridoxamine 5'-phosphate oxidase family protein [unclassified Rathayibacter]PPH11411.1 pyridoxamine 5'-phosphate oxidase family protein [Rathayibacter sp. AY1C1]PPH17899.1 pyridoxamine 5'-phosphate oxidase family protein [Rathayibacter sp. AY1F8]PPH76638.1 pyridoxamine 5'-phosphate oxidase family protein [Rathayibacter sp. AY1D4]PPH92766.1 pyridoxamine 5'-phosphate oxidase family protein [Rathayibacter sp. AY1D3]
MDSLPVTDRTRVSRLRDRQRTDPAELHALLDEALVAHVAVVRDGAAIVLPILFARDGDSLLLHGSSGGGLLREAARHSLLTASVTLVDGLVVARSTFDSSMNYRSAMVIGRAEALEGEEKARALDLLVARLLPGRDEEVRASSAREIAATLVLRLPLAEASLKVRAYGAGDEPEAGVWAGVVPLVTRTLAPVPAEEGVAVPESVRRFSAAVDGAVPPWR